MLKKSSTKILTQNATHCGRGETLVVLQKLQFKMFNQLISSVFVKSENFHHSLGLVTRDPMKQKHKLCKETGEIRTALQRACLCRQLDPDDFGQ